jgi:RNA polymerase sigma-70 factor (ECF subfamily)
MMETFEKIALEYQDKIFRLSYSFLRDRSAAEEITQEVLLRIWKGLPSFRSDSSLSTWIYAITRNACITSLGRSGPKYVSFEEPEVIRQTEQRAFNEWLMPEEPQAADLLNRLPAKYRQVVALFYMQEKSYDEVALMLDKPVGTVKTYLFRARKSLAVELAGEREMKGGTQWLARNLKTS